MATEHVGERCRGEPLIGFDTYRVSDATATFDRVGPDGSLHTAEEIQAMTLSNLNEELATIVATDEVLRWLR